MPIEVALPQSSFWGALLALARVGGVVALVPVPGWRRAPETTRIVFAICLTVALAPVWPVNVGTDASLGKIVGWVFSETMIGLAMGLAVSLLVEGFAIAAQLLGLQAGYGYASTIDPSTEADSGILPVVVQLAASLLFFSFGMEAQVIRALALSFSKFPPGAWVVPPGQLEGILALGAGMWTTALRLAMPVIGLLILLDLAMAILGKVATQLQLLSVAFPAKMLVTLATLAMLAAALPGLFEQQAATVVALWRR
ncbi:MAG: flagellar biosynthetic protein FliR [Bryobacterales bacterium]|nr:flagellar biosynthetic protein FliR [Bryobacterales bacterium]